MRKHLWLPVLLIALILAGCGPAQAPAAAQQQTGTGEVFVFALPRLVVDVDNAGNPVIFGINAGDFGRLIGADFSAMRFPPDTVRQMTAANVQHVEVRQVGDAAVFLVNGKPLPHIGWSDASLQQAAALGQALGYQNMDVYGKLLPIVRRLGLDLVVRFPRKDGASEIPLGDPNQVIKAQASTALPSAIAHFEVKYSKDGVPGIMDVTAADLARLGVNAPQLTLSPEFVQRLQANNIQTLELRGKSDGFYAYVNGNLLPNVVWDDTLLKNVTDLYVQANPNSPTNQLVQLAGPFLNKADIDILFHFPLAAGQAPIPAKMHE